jgi:hypothetical protein
MHHVHLPSVSFLLLVAALCGAALCEGLAALWGLAALARRQLESRQLVEDLRALGRRSCVHGTGQGGSAR